jgi:hypothetical protein
MGVVMHLKNLLAGVAVAAILSVGAQAAPVVVTFDGLPDGLVPDGYGGINWNSNWTVYSEPQNPYNPESPPARIYTNYSLHPAGNYEAVSFNFLTPAVFNGGYVAGGYSEGVTFELFNGASLVATSATLYQTATPTFLSSGYGGKVTSVEVLGYNGYYVLDNVTYSAVPEPSTWALMLAGFGALGFASWRRARAVAA